MMREIPNKIPPVISKPFINVIDEDDLTSGKWIIRNKKQWSYFLSSNGIFFWFAEFLFDWSNLSFEGVR